MAFVPRACLRLQQRPLMALASCQGQMQRSLAESLLRKPQQQKIFLRGLKLSSPRWEEGSGSEDSGKANNDTVIIDRIEHLHIMTVGLNRPEKRNCIDTSTAEKLKEAFLEFEADDNMYCAVLHGLGGNFCAGFDLDELAKLDQENLANTVAMSMIDRGPLGPTRLELTKPVIAAIDGWCVAGGLELALMADLRIADVEAKLGVLNRRFGVPLIDGGSVRLPELIGLSRALDVILTGRIIEAEEALSMGLVNRVTKTGQSFGRAMHLAKELIAHPQECLRTDRASAYHATFASRSLQESLEHEAMTALQVISKESIAGAKKFVTGLGKHGKFNVTPVAEPQQWQEEFAKMQKEHDDAKKKAKEEIAKKNQDD